ncbi:homolog of X-ray repair cross complementing 3, partial [Prunus dulcis]
SLLGVDTLQLHNRISRRVVRGRLSFVSNYGTSSAPTLTWWTRGLLRLHIHRIQLPFRRLQQLGNLYHASYPNVIRLERKIYVHGVHDAQELIHVLGDIEALLPLITPAYVNSLSDSIAAFPITGLANNEWGEVGKLGVLDTSGRRVSPALGLAWAHCINSRVFLARHEQSIEVDIRNAPSTSICSQTHRTFHLVFAPHLAYASAEFVIKKEGIVGVSQ